MVKKNGEEKAGEKCGLRTVSSKWKVQKYIFMLKALVQKGQMLWGKEE